MSECFDDAVKGLSPLGDTAHQLMFSRRVGLLGGGSAPGSATGGDPARASVYLGGCCRCRGVTGVAGAAPVVQEHLHTTGQLSVADLLFGLHLFCHSHVVLERSRCDKPSCAENGLLFTKPARQSDRFMAGVTSSVNSLPFLFVCLFVCLVCEFNE